MSAKQASTATFGELVDAGLLEVGDGYRAKLEELGGSGPIFLRAGHVTDTHIDFSGVEHFHAHLADSVRTKMSKVGDTIVTTKGNSTGRTSFVDVRMPPFVYSPHLSYWRSLDTGRIQPGFLRYWSRSPEFLGQLAGMKTSTDMAPYLSLTDQRRLRITLLEPQQQRAIAHILGTLDDKIELNRRMSETLEGIARALFKSWFVDFDPVRAKAEGRDPGLPKHLADLFPDSFEESELGEIPKGWRVAALRELSSYLSRGISPAYTESGGVSVLSQKCVRDRRLDFSKARRHDPDKKSTGNRLLYPLDILVNSTGFGTLGRAAQVWDLPEPTLVDSHITVIRPGSTIDPYFLGVYVTGREAEIETLGEGSTGQTELSRSRLGDLPCLLPSREIQGTFGRTVSPLIHRSVESERESRTLVALRNTLLPKLISGELRVKDAERFVEKAL